MSGNRRAVAISVLLLVAVLGAACSGATSSPARAAPTGGYAGGAGGTATQSAHQRATSRPSRAPRTNQSGVASLAIADRDLIVTGDIAMKSDDPWQTADGARPSRGRFGGSIVGLSESINNDRRTPTSRCACPSASFDDAINALKSLDARHPVERRREGRDRPARRYRRPPRRAAGRGDALPAALHQREDRRRDAPRSRSRFPAAPADRAARGRTEIDEGPCGLLDHLALRRLDRGAAARDPGKWDPARTFAVAIASFATLLRFMADLAIWFMVFCAIPLLVVASILVATRARRKLPAA